MYQRVLAPAAKALERVTGTVGGRALEGAEAPFNLAGVFFGRKIGTGEPAATLIEIADRWCARRS